MELITLWYLSSFILGKSKYRWPINMVILVSAGIVSVLVAVYLPKGTARMMLNLLAVFIPLTLFRGSFLTKLFTLLLLAAIGCGTEVAVKVILVVVNGGLAVVDNSFGKYIQGAVMSKFLGLAMVRLLMFFKKAQGQRPSGWAMLEMSVYPLASILAMSQLMSPNHYADDPQAYIRAFFVVCSLVVANILLFHVFERQAEQEKNKLQLALLHNQKEEQKHFYKELTAEKQKTNQLSHDIKHYLLAISGFIQEGQTREALAYLQKLKILNDSNYCHITGSLSIDAVIAEKQRRAERQGSIMQIKTKITSPLFVDEVDIALLLANALDNALEATDGLASAEINLNYQVDEYYIDIILTNTIQKAIKIENNTIVTSKADKEHHGLGLVSIHEIVKRYDGSIELRSNKDTFILDVMLGNVALAEE